MRELTPVQLVLRALIYVVLTAFALFMLFPFLYMLSKSFKISSDVFHYPPRLLPYSQEEVTTSDGEQAPLYRFVIEGQERQLLLADEKLPHLFFSTEEGINRDNPRDSSVVLAMPRDEALDTGLAVATGETVTIKMSDESEETFDVYDVTIAGQSQRLVEAYRGSLDKFVDPENPDIFIYANERLAEKSEYVDFRVCNYNTLLGTDLNRLLNQFTGVTPNDTDCPTQTLKLDRALINTTLVTVLVVAGQLVTSIFGGYAFSRVQFTGRNTLFVLYLGSIMIPFVVLIIPMYRLMVVLDWQNRIVSLILPWIFTAYGTFLLRQFFVSIPKEIEEAALLDGASRLRILWGIFVPLSKPAIATLAIFSFLYAWNSFLWPLLIIGEGNERNHVLTLALIRLSNAYADQPNLVLTGAAVAILPPIIVFILAQRYFIEGVTSSGVKG